MVRARNREAVDKGRPVVKPWSPRVVSQADCVLMSPPRPKPHRITCNAIMRERPEGRTKTRPGPPRHHGHHVQLDTENWRPHTYKTWCRPLWVDAPTTDKKGTMGLTRGINLSLSSHLCRGSTLEVLAASSDCSTRMEWSPRKLGGRYKFSRWMGLPRSGDSGG